MKKRTVIGITKQFAGDETGAIMTEYIVMVFTLIVGFIWLNKTADTVLFGASPYARFGSPSQTEGFDEFSYQAGDMNHGGQFTDATKTVLKKIGGDTEATAAAHPERAYLSQVYIALSRP